MRKLLRLTIVVAAILDCRELPGASSLQAGQHVGPGLQAQAPSVAVAQPGPSPFYLNSWTRLSGWDFFDDGLSGGDSDYTYLANRLRVGFQWQNEHLDLHAAGQYVQFAGLPSSAAGPGPLGLGAVYRAHADSSHPGSVYVRYLFARVRLPVRSGLSFQVGRFGYSGGGEVESREPAIQRIKDMRVSEKLIGEFGWSLFQRSFDGVRADWDHGFGHLTVAAFQPTQGGFEEQAGVSIDEIRVYTAAWLLRNGTVFPNNEVAVSFSDYSDDRAVTASRPDNSNLSTMGRMAVNVRNFGFETVGVYPVGPGDLDSLVSYSYQRGDWFGETHRAQALALEMGYQWNGRLRPWIRAGYLRGTGDRDPTDNTHGTFFQMLPTARKYSLSAAYNLMNNTDFFVQAILRPLPDLTVRADFHQVGLSNASDRWYFGAGATQAQGTVSGYGTRPSNGQKEFGQVFEVAVTRTVNAHWSVTGYYGHIRGGDVVESNFSGSPNLNFAFIENSLSF